MKMITLLILMFMMASCAEKEVDESGEVPLVELPTDPESSEPVPTPEPTVAPEKVDPKQEHRLIDGARPEQQLLNTHQIRNRLKCVDSRFDLTSIKSESIMAIGAEQQEGTNAFLLPNLYSAGDDIIEKNADLIDGPQYLTKTGTKLTNPSLDYLVALSNIANVVAHNCEILQKDNNPLNSDACECKTIAGATKIVSECLAILNLSDGTLQLLRDEFHEQCLEDPKSAISSLIASWGFVISP